MGLLLDKAHRLTIYDVPKGGGTTIRMWMTYNETHNLNLKTIGEGYVSQDVDSYKHLKNRYLVEWFRPTSGTKIAIKRDPIKRFISCYKDKIIREAVDNRTASWTIDKIIDDFPKALDKHPRIHNKKNNIRYLKYHFAPMVKHLGTDPSYYDEVFWLSEMDTRIKEYLEDTWKTKLPPLHCRSQKKSKSITLTDTQKKKIREIYRDDYKIWCP